MYVTSQTFTYTLTVYTHTHTKYFLINKNSQTNTELTELVGTMDSRERTNINT